MRAAGYMLIPLFCALAACNQNPVTAQQTATPAAPAPSAPVDQPQVANTTEVAPDNGRNAAMPTLAPMLKRASPGVVNISVEGTVEVGQDQAGGNPLFKDPFFRRFFNLPTNPKPMTEHVHAVGSGVIYDAAHGYILTNHHVIQDASKIQITLSDGRELPATLVASDEKTDVAVLKVNSTSLTQLPIGRSKSLAVGDYVVAIGDPFGVGQAATFGIVSALGRNNLGIEGYEDFIQTDASINPGNSGGPLINLRGEVIGINTAIFSRTGGNIGIGFAIPINLVKELLPQLRGKGKVTRGYLGVLIQKVTPEIAESLGMEKASGALVANVSKDGPADKAGVKVGDVIVEFDGKEVKDSGELPILVARTAVDKKARLKVLRDKQEVTLTVAVGELKDEEVVATAPEKGELGLTVQRLTPQMAESLGLEKSEGVVVTAVEPGSAADEAGIRRGDVILEVDRKTVRNLDEYKKAIAGARKGRGVLFLVRRGDNTLFLALKPQG